MARRKIMASKILTAGLAILLLQLTVARSSAQALAKIENGAISDTNFTVIAQEIRDLKNPEFRAQLRAQLLSMIKASDSAERRHAALTVGTEALSDLRDNKEVIGLGVAGWLYESLAGALRKFGGDDAEAMIARFALKKDDGPSPGKDLMAAVKSLSDPENAAAAREKATAAILTGQIPADAILGSLLALLKSNNPNLPELMSAVLTVEERQTGFIPLNMLTFFSAVFLQPPASNDIQNRFLQAVVKSTRVPPANIPRPLADRTIVSVLQAILDSTKTVAPALYPEVAARLTSLGSSAVTTQPEREAVEARIKASPDQLEALQLEAERASSEASRRSFLLRAARLALTQGRFRQAVDLEIKAYGDRSTGVNSMDRFFADVTTAALKQQQPDAAEYAVSKMTQALIKAQSLLQLGKYYVSVKDKEKSKSALALGLKLLDQTEVDNDKLSVAIAFAQGAIPVDSSIAYEAMRLTVETINKLPPRDNQKENLSYRSLIPHGRALVEAYRLFASPDTAAALALAQDIKLPELRVAALLGAYSAPASK
jgi:hypothetical protein